MFEKCLTVLDEQLQRIDAKVEAPRAKQYACLVDAENTQPSKLAAIVSELTGYGEVVVRRIYGDFSQPNLLPWKAVSNELSFRPHAQFAIISGKGSADMAMAMDAVDLLHDSGLVIDGFALVSSDSDFTPLASKLREEGRHVVGFGRRTTPSPFVNACHAFVHLENLGSTQPPAMAPIAAGAGEQGSAAALLHTIEQVRLELEKQKAENKVLQQELVKAKSQLSSDNADEALAGAPEAREATKFTGLLKGLDVDLDEALASCLSDKPSANGWVDISLLANTLRRRKPSWDVRNYGVTKNQGLKGLLELPEVSKLFELQNSGKSAWKLRQRR
jgi:uncharacterized protein (TIGR00288 family)